MALLSGWLTDSTLVGATDAGEWRNRLLQLATESGDPNLLLQTVEAQLMYAAVHQELYPYEAQRLWTLLRGSVSHAGWPAHRATVVANIHAALGGTSSSTARKYFDKQITRVDALIDTELAKVAKAPTWTLLRQYDRFWLPDRAEALVGLYARALPELFARKGPVTRTDYQQMAQRLRALVELPGCDEPVALLVEELMTTYARRSALIEELRAAGFGPSHAAKGPIRLGDGNGEFDDDDDAPAPARRGRPTAGLVPPAAGKKRGRKPTGRIPKG